MHLAKCPGLSVQTRLYRLTFTIREIFTRFYLRHALQDTVVVIKTGPVDFALFDRFANGTAGIAAVFTIAEFAIAKECAEFDKSAGNLLRLKMP